jgi:hypothetical protein
MEITEIKELACQPRSVDEEDVLVEPISALEELYASIPYSADGPDRSQGGTPQKGRSPWGSRITP